ncbi:MAG: metallophosphoesterase family protein [Candidatus Brocadiae bacterium]|nr:metallophosphoesterase family protein [Candidatus Brocadiia bacterium]
MRFGIIADVHANLEALSVALKVLGEEGVDQIICLGDVVGYNANPIECLSIIMERHIPCIKGNHERHILGEKSETLKEDTDKVLAWTKNQLKKEQYDFIVNDMPNKMLHESGFLITHGSPRNKDEYLLKLHSFVTNLKLMEEKYPDIRICFHGHTHLPSIMAKGHIAQDFTQDTLVELHPDRQYLINPGSVGQPRDQCPLTSFGIYDEDKLSFQFYRRPYDIATTQEKILKAGLSSRLAERLALGK